MKYSMTLLVFLFSINVLCAQPPGEIKKAPVTDNARPSTISLGIGLLVGSYSGATIEGEYQERLSRHFALGGFISLGGAQNREAVPYTRAEYTQLIIGPRITVIIKETPSWNVYLSGLLGYRGRFYALESTESSLAIAAHIGVQYFLLPHVGLYGEVGFGKAALSGGIVFRIQ